MTTGSNAYGVNCIRTHAGARRTRSIVDGNAAASSSRACARGSVA